MSIGSILFFSTHDKWLDQETWESQVPKQEALPVASSKHEIWFTQTIDVIGFGAGVGVEHSL